MATSKITTDSIQDNTITSQNIQDNAITPQQLEASYYQSTLAPYRNRIIGGDFTTNPWQRGTSFTGVTGQYTADRFRIDESTDSVVDVIKTADAPTIVESGTFTQHCFHVDVTTPDNTLDSSQYCQVLQAIEGYNVADLGFGQTGSRSLTLSFWHKHTKPGTHSLSLRNADVTRSYVVEYTQTTTNVWEKAKITIPVDTTGTWNYTSGIGLFLTFTVGIGDGSPYQTDTIGSWQNGNYIASTNQVNNLDSASNDFKIALVQLEAGEQATPFEALPPDVVLQRCQRYLQRSFGGSLFLYKLPVAYSNATLTGSIELPVPMRSTPVSLNLSSGNSIFSFSTYTSSFGYYADYNIQVVPIGNSENKIRLTFSYRATNNSGNTLPSNISLVQLPSSATIYSEAEL